MNNAIPLIALTVACLTFFPRAASGVVSIATIDYSPGEFESFGANRHFAGAEGEDEGPYTFSNIDGLGMSLTVSGSAPVISEFAGNTSFPPAFLLGDSADATVLWQLDPGHVVEWVEFDFRYLSGPGANTETFSDFIGTGANISAIDLMDQTEVTWDGSVLTPSGGDGSGTLTIEFETPASGFGWNYNLVAGNPQGAGITEMRLGVTPIPEPTTAGLVLLGLLSSLARRRR